MVGNPRYIKCDHLHLVDIFNLYSMCICDNIDIVFAWLPGHVCMWENIVVDLVAKHNNNNSRIQRCCSRFFTISSQRRCLQHIRSRCPSAIMCKSSATHQAFIMCKCHVACHLVRRDSSAGKFDRVEVAFI